MNIAAGLYRPDEGEIRVGGRPVVLRSPRDAIAAGLGMVHQHFTLVPSQSVTENVILGLDRPRFRLHLGRFETEVGDLARRFGLTVDPRAKVWQLSVGEQQRVEILKMLYRGARVLIMDEPTAVLAPQEVDDLFRTLRSMTGDGHSIVFISHKLQEVLAIADRVTVMRRGKVTAAGRPTAGATRADLARLMVGREVLENLDRTTFAPGPVVLSLRDIYADNDKGLPALRGASLDVRAGEILGIAAVAGNGQSELAQVVTGLRTWTGRVEINGQAIGPRLGTRSDPAWCRPRARGPDRRRHRPEPVGGGQPDHEELSLGADLARLGHRLACRSASGERAQGEVRDHGAVDRHERTAAVGRQPPAADPGPRDRDGAATHGRGPAVAGLDVGAIEAVHRLLLDRRAQGAATLLISEDLDEILALSDRVAVISEGRVVGLFEAADADVGEIGLLMTGGGPEPDPALVGGPGAARRDAQRPSRAGSGSNRRSRCASSDAWRSRAGSVRRRPSGRSWSPWASVR